jgi:putative salt-induced outer membrane protein YdiY
MPFRRSLLIALVALAFTYATLVGLNAQEAGPGVLPPPGANAIVPPAAEGEAPPLFSFPETTAEAIAPPTVLEEAVGAETQVLEENTELIEPPVVYEWYQWSYWFGPAPWDMGVNFGLNGSEGQNSTQSIASGAYLKRDSAQWTLDSKINYNMTSANSVETQNNALLDARVDRKLDKSAWSLYILNQMLYDEFQPFDLRVSVNSGVGYKWVKTENFNLLGRFGAGASREFGGVQDEWAPEALFGLDYEYLISDKQRLTMKVDYFPEWGNFNNYRVVSDAGWEVDLDKPKNMSLRFTVNDRYDSTPNGVSPNLVNYAVLLNWKL